MAVKKFGQLFVTASASAMGSFSPAAIRELEAHQKGIGRMDSLAMVALQLAVNLSKLSDARARRENEIKTALEKLGERWEAEAERIKGHSEE